MPVFKVLAHKPDINEYRTFLYDSEKSTLTDEEGISLVKKLSGLVMQSPEETKRIYIGKNGIKVLKIQLGLSCNFSCEYCSQRFVPHATQTGLDKVDEFLNNLDSWLKDVPQQIEFWGGEPFVYWKTMKPLAEALRERFPETTLSVITNGSLIDDEKIEWLDRLGFNVAVSHDGPGQFVRGPDPLDDPKSREAILKLFKTLAPQNRFSFNAMLNRSNQSRADIQKFFEELVKPYQDYLVIGEGAIIDAYDEGGAAQSLKTEELALYRNKAFGEIRAGMVNRFNGGVTEKIMSFVNSLRFERSWQTIAQKCGMDKPENLAVDLNGNVLTCQNVSPVSVNPAGVSHKLGHVSDLASVEVKTSTNWRDRDECPKCPMLHICKGSCFFLSGDLWEKSCDNAYSDSVPIFAAAIEFLTGYVPVHIEGPHRDDRHDIWGWGIQLVDTNEARNNI
jgi:uncharacterized protein